MFAAIAALTLIPGQATFLGNLYAFGAMLSFTIAHVSVTAHADRAPRRRRGPTGRPATCASAGVDLPLFAIVGGACTFASLVVLAALHTSVAIAGVGWLTVGMIVYTVYRHRHGLDLTTTTKVAIPGRRSTHEAEYESVLVAFDDEWVRARGDGDRRADGRPPAARDPRAGDDPRAVEQPDRRRAARAGGGGRSRSSRRPRSRPAGACRATGRRSGRPDRPADRRRGPGDARRGDRDADAPDGAGFGRALETVLRERPCRVIIESIPARAQAAEPWRRSRRGDETIGGTCSVRRGCTRAVARASADRSTVTALSAALRRGRDAGRGRARHRRASPRFSRPRRRRRAREPVPAGGAADRDPARTARRARDRGPRRARRSTTSSSRRATGWRSPTPRT